MLLQPLPSSVRPKLRTAPALRAAFTSGKHNGDALPVPVETVDERLTTVTAERSLRAGGVRGRRRREVVDKVAAAVLLQAWLDARASRS